MTYRKFQAAHIFTGTEMLGPDMVLITDENGKIDNIVSEKEAGLDIQTINGILTPGFVNCHCHIELSHMKGLIPENTGLVDFILSILTLRHFPEDDILQAIADAESEMLQNGIVAVGDISNNATSFHQKSKNNLAWQVFLELSGWSPQIADMRFQNGLAAYQQFEQLVSTQFKLSMAAHAPYSVSKELWELIAPYYQNKITSLHNQETHFEDDFLAYKKGDFTRLYDQLKVDTDFYQPTGKSSLQSVANHFAGAAKVLLVHDTFTKPDDIDFIQPLSKEQNTDYYLCLCVNANQYINHTMPPIELFRKKQSDIVVGTDSLASNHSLSILDELKTISSQFPSIPITEQLQWATFNGARALGFDKILGSFDSGKKPGLLQIDQLENGEIVQETSVNRIL